jgi:hypothetical protein
MKIFIILTTTLLLTLASARLHEANGVERELPAQGPDCDTATAAQLAELVDTDCYATKWGWECDSSDDCANAAPVCGAAGTLSADGTFRLRKTWCECTFCENDD